MDHEQLEESLSLYALGTLEPDSAREVESHLASGCPHCGALLRQYQSTAALLPHALPPHTPPAELKSRVMRAIAGQELPATEATLQLTPPKVAPPPSPAPAPAPIHRRPSSRPAGQSLALAAALGGLLLGAGGYAAYLYVTLEAERAAYDQDRKALAQAALRASDLERQLAERQRDVGKATEELNRAIQALRTTHELLAKHQEQIEALRAARPGKSTEEIARIFSSPYAKMASLAGTDMAKDAYALVFVEPDTRRGFFYASNLPALPAGKTYQLWVITDEPVSAGVFPLDRGRKGRVMLHDIPDVARIKQFAVSLEPEGGRPQPTGRIYLAGAL
jgi:anti-sigma-K factor RskA/predicted  nucleic acid-binding Zn-ribbon protein